MTREHILNLTLKPEFQILGWLSTSPTDIESYIRPGCIILTVYVRLVESTWREVPFFHIIILCHDSDHLVS
jgi:hypothetical protein